MTKNQSTLLLAVLIGLGTITGCSELSSKVSGRILLDGQPMTIAENHRGTVVFCPIGGGPTTTAQVDSNGSYSLTTGGAGAVRPGDYLVSVRIVELVAAKQEGDPPAGRPLTPALYANPIDSGIQFTVKSGVNQCDIELDSSAGPVVIVEPELIDGSDEAATDLYEESKEQPVEKESTLETPNSESDAQPTSSEQESTVEVVESTVEDQNDTDTGNERDGEVHVEPGESFQSDKGETKVVQEESKEEP